MRLVTFQDALGPGSRVGALIGGDRVVDLRAALAASFVEAGQSAASAEASSAAQMPIDMIELFVAGEVGRAAAVQAITFAGSEANGPSPDGRAMVHASGAVKLLAPVPRPTRIRDYLTYDAHAAGSGLKLPPAFYEMPICYKGNPFAVIGTGEEISWPAYTDQLDYELELGFYISKEGRNIPVEEAGAYIAGATIFNDVSARDIQMREMSLTIGPSKGKDFCNVMGPCITTMDELDEFNIGMRARVNGEVWSEGSSKGRAFSFAQVVSWASYCETIYPGEFIAVGTVGGGCGFELGRWIQPGDMLELEMDGIGVLRNRIGQKEQVPANAGLKSFVGAAAVGTNR